MKAKLIVHAEGYALLLNEKLVAFTHSTEFSKENVVGKLSLKNCQAIEHGYDLDELKRQASSSQTAARMFLSNTEFIRGWEMGFQKSLELMSDKKFSEDDVRLMLIDMARFIATKELRDDWDLDVDAFFRKRDFFIDKQIQSLQQTEWDVHLEMTWNPRANRCNECGNGGNYMNKPCDHPTDCIHWSPVLDEEGCFILKRINNEDSENNDKKELKTVELKTPETPEENFFLNPKAEVFLRKELIDLADEISTNFLKYFPHRKSISSENYLITFIESSDINNGKPEFRFGRVNKNTGEITLEKKHFIEYDVYTPNFLFYLILWLGYEKDLNNQLDSERAAFHLYKELGRPLISVVAGYSKLEKHITNPTFKARHKLFWELCGNEVTDSVSADPVFPEEESLSSCFVSSSDKDSSENLTNENLINFLEAFDFLNKGKKIKLPEWGDAYWIKQNGEVKLGSSKGIKSNDINFLPYLFRKGWIIFD